jgi:hypothetical protein
MQRPAGACCTGGGRHDEGGRGSRQRRGRKRGSFRFGVVVEVGLLRLQMRMIMRIRRRVSPGRNRHRAASGKLQATWLLLLGGVREGCGVSSLGSMSHFIHMFEAVRRKQERVRSLLPLFSLHFGLFSVTPIGGSTGEERSLTRWGQFSRLDFQKSVDVIQMGVAGWDAFVPKANWPIGSRRHREGATGSAFIHDPLNEESTSRGMKIAGSTGALQSYVRFTHNKSECSKLLSPASDAARNGGEGQHDEILLS